MFASHSLAACFEPPARLQRAATRDNVQQTSRRGHRRSTSTRPDDAGTDPHEQRLVQPERGRSPIRSGSSSTSVVPYAITASLTVCHAHPSSPVTSFTVRPCSPTWRVTHRPARSVITTPRRRDPRIFTGPRPASHTPRSRHSHRCFRHTSRAGRPNAADRPARPRAVLDLRRPAQREHVGRPSRSRPCTRNGPCRSSSTPSTFTAGSPTNSSQIRGGSTSTGALPNSTAVDTFRFAGPLSPVGAALHPAHFRSAAKRCRRNAAAAAQRTADLHVLRTLARADDGIRTREPEPWRRSRGRAGLGRSLAWHRGPANLKCLTPSDRESPAEVDPTRVCELVGRSAACEGAPGVVDAAGCGAGRGRDGGR